MKYKIYTSLIVLAFTSFVACSNDKEEDVLKNDFIKKTTSPLIVGESIDFAYAMGAIDGKMKNAYVEASIAGSVGTNFESKAWHTEGGKDISTEVAKDCVTDGKISSAHIIDSKAITLRYKYVIPEDARGKDIHFVFSSESAVVGSASIKTPSYRVSTMDMAKKIVLENTDGGARYFSIEDMKAYTKNEVIAGNLSSKIDFIYGEAGKKTVNGNQYDYKHAFFSPAAENYYPDNFTLPADWTKNSTLMEKKLYVWDGQLREDVNTNIYVDDLDMQKQTFNNAPNFVLDLRADGSLFLQTHDKKFVAFIYINSLKGVSSAANTVIGIKRYRY